MTTPPHPDNSAALTSYVAPYVLRRLSRGGPPELPAVEPMAGALLLADIAGFTRLSEQLAERGLDGAEALTLALNGYFAWMIDRIREHGGEVVGFAGDALMAMWPSSEDTHSQRQAVLRSAACALVLAVPEPRAIVSKEAPLTVRFGLVAGEFFGVELGGYHGHRNCVLAGTPVEAVAEVNDLAKAGEIVMDAGAWKLVSDVCEGEPCPGGAQLLTGAPPSRLVQLSQPERPSHEVVDALSAYVPQAVFGREETGQGSWLAEIRHVTVLFVNLPDCDFHVSAVAAQELAATLQEELDRHEATINKLSIDSHGTNLVVATGLPPRSHDDDAVRGVRSALAVAEALERMGRPGAIGVATGRAFCGPIGNQSRREYTMIGDVVNTAARLMQAALELTGSERESDAASNGEGTGTGPVGPGTVQILCDSATHRAAQHRIEFSAARELRVKGKSSPLVVYRPTRRRTAGAAADTAMVGRDLERDVVLANLEAARGGECRVVMVEGEPGIGKTQLVNAALALAHERGVQCLAGAGDPIERTVPYHAWRNVFATALGVDDHVSPAARVEQTLLALEGRRDQGPLLNVLLGLGIEDTPSTASITGELRTEAAKDLMLELLGDVARQPLMITIDDSHWLDSASWALILELSRRKLPVLLLLASRPVGHDALPAEASRLVNQANTKVLRLSSLEAGDAVSLVCARLGVVSLPDKVASLIVQKSGGNPLFAEELAYALLEAGVIAVADGECTLAAPEVALVTVTMHDTVEGVIGSRIDSLEARPELALKVASVVGPYFSPEVVRDVFPVPEDRRYLPGCLETLVRRNLTVLEHSTPSVQYSFRHALTRDVAYNRMLFAHRRELHKAVAEWYERNHGDALEPLYSALAYHWTRAEVVDKACQYLELATLQAVNNGMGREAVNLGLEAAAMLGVRLPRDLAEIGKEIGLTLAAIEERLANRPLEYLAELPPLEDEAVAGAIQILLQTVPAAAMTQQFELFALMGLRAFLLTIDHGATPFTPAVISIFAMLVRALLQDYERAFALTTLAKELADRDCPPVRSYAGFVHSWYTNHWLKPIRPSLHEMLEDSQKGLDHGDVQFGCFNAAGYVVLLARSGAPLEEVAAAGAEMSERIGGRVAAAAFHSLHEMQMAKALAGRTSDRYSFADRRGEGSVQEQDVASIKDTDLNNEIAYYYISKMKLHYYYRDFAEAVRFAEQADELRMSFTGQAEEAEFVFFYGLALIALAGPGDDALLERAVACLAQTKAWAGVGPRNFTHKVLMIEGELARVAGDKEKAVALLCSAAEEAHGIEYVHHAALALELAGRCLLEDAQGEAASQLLEEAARCYERWGAKVKFDDVMATLAGLP